MLYKFKSKAAGDLIMLEPNGRKLLQVIGKDPGPTGIILTGQMAEAISALQRAVEQEESERQAAVDAAAAEGKTPPKGPDVSLRQRAAPMIDMLRRCLKENEEIVWGV